MAGVRNDLPADRDAAGLPGAQINTGVIRDLCDHTLAKALCLLAGSDEERGNLPDGINFEAGRPLVGTADANGVIDPDVLWSCTNCGACVKECPVDIEHIDGMRRHQVLIKSAFPEEASGC